MGYLPDPPALEKLGFRPALSTSGIWLHAGAGVWLVLLRPTDLALSATQYEAGTRYSPADKACFYASLCATAPGWDFKTNKKKPL